MFLFVKCNLFTSVLYKKYNKTMHAVEKYQSDYSVKYDKTTTFCLISELVFLSWTEAAVLIWECRSEQNACTLVLFEALRNYSVGSIPKTYPVSWGPLFSCTSPSYSFFFCIPSFVLFSSQVTVSLHIHLPFFLKHICCQSEGHPAVCSDWL